MASPRLNGGKLYGTSSPNRSEIGAHLEVSYTVDKQLSTPGIDSFENQERRGTDYSHLLKALWIGQCYLAWAGRRLFERIGF